MWRQLCLVILVCHLRASAANIFCDFADTVNISSAAGYYDENGYNHDGILYIKGNYGEFDYVIDNFLTKTKVEPHLRGCICNYRPCIRVCCRNVGENCVNNNLLTVPLANNQQKEIDLNSKEYGILEGFPKCKSFYSIDPDEWIFLNNNVLMLHDDESHDKNSYCFSQQIDEDGKVETGVEICSNEEKLKTTNIRSLLYTIGMIFSLPFLVITFCVYGFVPALRNVHGKCLMCYVSALLVMYIGWCIIKLEDSFHSESYICIFVGYMVYVSMYICFFWLNIMCFDIWNTFRGNTKSRGGEQKKFLFYCLYAFGVPVLLTALVFLIDNTGLFSEQFQPQIGFAHCWIQSVPLVEAIYVYIPISIIFAVNIVFYSITAYKIFTVQKETAIVRSGESQRHAKGDADKDRFFLYLRLFIIMGASWSMESISWMFSNRFYSFYISDFINCVQGFIIFILFVWKPKVRDLVRQRYRAMRKLPPVRPQKVDSIQTETTKASSSASNSHHDVREHIDLTEKPMLS